LTLKAINFEDIVVKGTQEPRLQLQNDRITGKKHKSKHYKHEASKR